MTDDPLDKLEAEHREPHGSRVEFQEQLAEGDAELVAVGRLVVEAVQPVTSAFLEGDAYTAQQWMARDTEVDRRCRDLEERCYLLLARQSPVAGDLRRIVAVLRSTQDVERSGDLIRHVAESLTWIHPPSLPEQLREIIGQLGDISADLLARSLTAWEQHDALAANELDAADDQVDLLQKVLLTELYTGGQSVEESVSLALIGRYYERIADHGVEIARQAAYFLTGQRPDQAG